MLVPPSAPILSPRSQSHETYTQYCLAGLSPRQAKGSKYDQVAKNQNYKCPICGQFLINGEDIETHHKIPVKDGGLYDTENLIHLHKSCHKHEHSKPKFKA